MGCYRLAEPRFGGDRSPFGLGALVLKAPTDLFNTVGLDFDEHLSSSVLLKLIKATLEAI